MHGESDLTQGCGRRSMSGAFPAQTVARWYAIVILIITYILAFLDRQILSLLVAPIKRDLQLSDTQVSVLQGIAFAGLMALAGLPIGRLVDTRSRSTLIATGVAIWSVMTASCGLARSYGELLFSRMGVGLGEACLTPAAYSLLADWFPPKRHGLVFGIYGVGAFLGLGLSYIVGGEVIRRIGLDGQLVVPWIGELPAWRVVFMLVGIPGLVVAGLGATLTEPRCRGFVPGEVAGPSRLNAVAAYFCGHWRPILLANLCIAFAAMTGYSLTAWTPTLFIRTYGWTAAHIGSAYGLVVALSGTVGYLVGGWGGDVLVSRGIIAGRLILIAGAAVVAIPITVVAPLMANPQHVLDLYGVAMIFIALAVGLGPVVQLSLVPANLRGTAIALGVLTVNIVGLGLGPTAVALVTDYVIGDERQIRYALAVMPASMLFLCATFGVWCIAPYCHCVRRLNAAPEN